MTARERSQNRRRKRRRHLWRALVLGGAAVGIPAAANALIARRNQRLRRPGWGRGHRYAWRHGEIAFQRLGKGPAVVCLHSFGPGHDNETWKETAENLAAGYEVFAPDFLGWGRSDKPRVTYDGELYLELVADFLEDVVRQPAVLAAAGLPAAYAVQTAADHPEAVRALALAVPCGIELSGEEPDLQDALVNRLLRFPILGTSALNLYTSQAAIGSYLRREAFAAADRVDAARVEHHYRSSHQPGSHLGLAALLSGYLNHRVEDVLARVAVPIWLGWGRQASLPPLEIADLWLERQPRAHLEVFEGTGNMPYAEIPARFAASLRDFLGRLEA